MSTSTARQSFRETVALVAARAKERLPEAVNGRVESAARLVLLHDVEPQEDGSMGFFAYPREKVQSRLGR